MTYKSACVCRLPHVNMGQLALVTSRSDNNVLITSRVNVSVNESYESFGSKFRFKAQAKILPGADLNTWASHAAIWRFIIDIEDHFVRHIVR